MKVDVKTDRRRDGETRTRLFVNPSCRFYHLERFQDALPHANSLKHYRPNNVRA
jgi:hypothetical protein